MTLSPTCRALIEKLYKPMRAPVIATIERALGILDDAEPGRWKVKVHDTHRIAARQWAKYAIGREKQDDGSWKVVGRTVTNATPAGAPHCISAPDGTPASMAVDLWIVDARSGELAKDGEIVWAVIPAAAYLAAPHLFVSGTFFKSIPGGDSPHLEFRGWKTITKDGVLLAGAA